MAESVAFARVPEVIAVKGGFATGKTTAIVNAVLELLAGGTKGEDILVFAASPLAADDLAERLRVAAPEGLAKVAADVRVTVPREYQLEALATHETQTITGRDARLLNSFEYDFLMEDLKTSTIPLKRLSEMMKFFNRQFSELRDFDEDWFYTNEERELYELLRDCLGFTRGIMPSEVAGLFVRAARGGVTAKVPYVFVDDFRCLSRGSQIAASLIAEKRLTVADNPEFSMRVFEDYPYPAGLDELEEANPEMRVVELGESHSCPAGYAAVDAYLHQAALPAVSADELNKVDWDLEAAQKAKGIKEVHLPKAVGTGAAAVEQLTFATPQKEYRGVAAYVEARIAEGVAPGDIVVVTTNRTWQRNLGVALAGKGIPVSDLSSGKVFAGDIRDFAYCDAHQVYTALALLADFTDGVAWRSWLGFGDWLTNSNGMKLWRNRAAMGGQAIDAALEMLPLLANADAEKGGLSCANMAKAVDRCKDLYGSCAGLAGSDLLRAVTRKVLGADAKVPALVEKLVAPFVDGTLPGKTAAAMVARARRRLDYPTADPNTVRLVPYDEVVGVSPKVLVIAGFVNGFMPKHDFFDLSELIMEKREKRRVEDLIRTTRVFATATERILVTGFDTIDLEVATRSHLVMDRIGLVDGVRTAFAQKSVLLDYL